MSYLNNIIDSRQDTRATRDAEQALRALADSMRNQNSDRITCHYSEGSEGEIRNPSAYTIAIPPFANFAGAMKDLRDQLTVLLNKEQVIPSGSNGNTVTIGDHEGSPAVILTLNGFQEVAADGKTHEVSAVAQYTRLTQLVSRCKEAGGRSL